MVAIEILDLNCAMALVNAVVAEAGEDFAYEPDMGDCVYVQGSEVWNPEAEEYDHDYSDLKPGCLVGRALIKGGVDPIDFVNLNINEEDAATALNVLVDKGVIGEFTEEAREFLTIAQIHQDKNVPWGQAVRKAREQKYV